MKFCNAVLCLVFAALAGPALGQSPPLQPEFQVSQGTLYYQYSYGVAIDRTGQFVVCWSSYTETDSNYDVLGRLYDPAGAPVGGEFEIDASTANQIGGDVAKDASGAFVVVWQDADTQLQARRFDADGTPRGPAFPVTTSTLPVSDSYVASDASGRFAVAWTRLDPSSSFDVVARLFDSAGAPLTGELPINSYTTGSQRTRGVGMSNNHFVLVWGGDGFGGPGVWTRSFVANGTPLTDDLQVNQGSLLFNPPEASVAMSEPGTFVVVWDGLVAANTLGVFGRRYDLAGLPIDDQFMVNTTYTTGYQGSSRIAADRHGNFIVSWTGRPSDGDAAGVLARTYDRFGVAQSADFVVNTTATGYQYNSQVALNEAGTFVVTWSSPDASYYGVVGRRSAARAAPEITIQNAVLRQGSTDSVIEPGDAVLLRTAWANESTTPLGLTGAAADFSGPPGATYTTIVATADYGAIAASSTGTCLDGAGNCYAVEVSAPAVRPAQHWDTKLQESLSIGMPHTWVLHIGESFPDVPTSHIFYAFIETLFHNGITGGCAGGDYCPGNPVTRAQMAVFLLKSKFGEAHVPLPCTGTVFTDVPCTGGPFDPWIEELAALQITGGCGGGLYCPNNPVNRQQMSVFLLKTLEGAAYVPPPCTDPPPFDDVPCQNGFSIWINELASRAITGGCSVTPPLYCPANPNNRGQMAVFLTKTFGLVLYGG